MPDINIISGNLTVSGVFAASGYAYIPSGYTNTSFTPGGLYLTYLNSGNNLGLGSWTTGIKARYLVTEDAGSRHVRTQKWQLLTGNSLDALIPTNKFNYNTLEAFVPFSIGSGPQFVRAANSVYSIDERFRHIESSGTFALGSQEKIGIGTFQPSEKVHVAGNLRVAGSINPTIDNFSLALGGSFFPPVITGILLQNAKVNIINGDYFQSQLPNVFGNFIYTNSSGAQIIFGSGAWYARSGAVNVYKSDDLQIWQDIGGGLPLPTATLKYLN